MVFIAPFCFHYDIPSDTVLMRGALYKSTDWTSGEIVAYVPTSMIPVYACGWVGSTYTSTAAVASGELRQTSGELRLWNWSLHQGYTTTPSGAAIWFDGTSYRKGAL